MAYVVVSGFDGEKKLCHVVSIDDKYNFDKDLGWLNTQQTVGVALSYGLTPLNFSIDRNRQLKMNCGDFARFSKNGSAVVIAEIRTRSGRTMGYRLLSCANNVVVNLKLEDILQREAAYGKDEHFLQNGIIRNKTVNCYPMMPYPIIEWSKEKKTPQPKPKKEEIRQSKDKASEFTPEQLAEISKCEKSGLNSRFIRNSKLSPNQMRVLWVSKSKGAMSESFANPRLSSEAMKFYADRLYDKKTVMDCKEMLDHPELSVDELSELYLCLCDGIPYSKYIGMSATEISTQRDYAKATYWGSNSVFDTDYYQKALSVAMKIKGY